MIQCFVFDGEPETLDAMATCGADWVAAISWRAMWGQRDWYPRLLDALDKDFVMLVPVTNEPAPDWQAAGSPTDDMLIQRRIASRSEGSVVDVTNESETAAPVAAIVERRYVRWILKDGLLVAHDAARVLGHVSSRSRGRVGLVPSVYAVHL